MLEGGIIGDIGTEMGSKDVISVTCSVGATRLEDGDRGGAVGEGDGGIKDVTVHFVFN